MPAFGISTAVTALVGRYIGAGRPDVAAAARTSASWSRRSYMLVVRAAFYILGRNVLMGLFTHDPEVLRSARSC